MVDVTCIKDKDARRFEARVVELEQQGYKRFGKIAVRIERSPRTGAVDFEPFLLLRMKKEA